MLDFVFQSFAVIRPLVGDSSFVFSLLIGLMFGLFILACFYVASVNIDPVRRRVAEGGTTEANSTALARQIVSIFSPLKNAMVPTNEKELSGIQSRLTHAGYRSGDSVLIYYAIKLISIIFFGVIGLFPCSHGCLVVCLRYSVCCYLAIYLIAEYTNDSQKSLMGFQTCSI